jgi:hypothetical protein
VLSYVFFDKKTFECLSRQSSLVINIVGTENISRLLRLVRGLTGVWRGAGGGVGRAGQPSPTPHCPVYTPQSFVWRLPPTHPGIRAAGGAIKQEGMTQHIAALQLPYVCLPFPFSGNPVSSQYLETLLSYSLGLYLVPLSCLIPSFAAVASSTVHRYTTNMQLAIKAETLVHVPW